MIMAGTWVCAVFYIYIVVQLKKKSYHYHTAWSPTLRRGFVYSMSLRKNYNLYKKDKSNSLQIQVSYIKK